MKVLFLFGNAAVGKMTVGQELMKITDLRLFHNHMTIDPVLEVFGTFNGNAICRLREVIFEEFAASDNYGMIFTFMWAFDCKEDWEYTARIREIFLERNKDTEFYYAELHAPKEMRLKRNITANRLKNKASKNNTELSNQLLIKDDERYRCESLEGEIPFENYIKIDNSYLSAPETAKIIKNRFAL